MGYLIRVSLTLPAGNIRLARGFGLPNSAKATVLGDILTNTLNVARFVREASMTTQASVTAGI